MKQQTKQKVQQSIQDFHLPHFDQIPNVGLYLEQVAKYINEYLLPLGDYGLTPSMISNYVKKGLVSGPVKKLYDREQIAYLFFIAVAKTVLSLDALTGFIEVQKRSYPLEVAYGYFCRQMETMLRAAFELTEEDYGGELESTDEKRLFSSCISAVCQKIYLEKCLSAIAEEAE